MGGGVALPHRKEKYCHLSTDPPHPPTPGEAGGGSLCVVGLFGSDRRLNLFKKTPPTFFFETLALSMQVSQYDMHYRSPTPLPFPQPASFPSCPIPPTPHRSSPAPFFFSLCPTPTPTPTRGTNRESLPSRTLGGWLPARPCHSEAENSQTTKFIHSF